MDITTKITQVITSCCSSSDGHGREGIGHELRKTNLPFHQGRTSRASSRASHLTSALSAFGGDDLLSEGKKIPLSKCVDWPLIVQKYLEYIGEASVRGEGLEE